MHDNSSNDLLANEVPNYHLSALCSYHFPHLVPSHYSRGSKCPHIPDLDLPEISLVVLLQVDVNGEMGIDVSHLVLEAFRDTNDQVVDQRSDGAESGDILAGTVV